MCKGKAKNRFFKFFYKFFRFFFEGERVGCCFCFWFFRPLWGPLDIWLKMRVLESVSREIWLFLGVKTGFLQFFAFFCTFYRFFGKSHTKLCKSWGFFSVFWNK